MHTAIDALDPALLDTLDTTSAVGVDEILITHTPRREYSFRRMIFAIPVHWTHARLSVAQEHALTLDAQAGCPRALATTQARMAPFVEACILHARRHFPAADVADMESAAQWGLHKALTRYAPTDSQRFSTFSRLWIGGTILEAARKIPVGMTGAKRGTVPPHCHHRHHSPRRAYRTCTADTRHPGGQLAAQGHRPGPYGRQPAPTADL